MNSLHIEVDGEDVPLDVMWVHLQSARSQNSRDYAIRVPLVVANTVFDPDSTRAPDTPLELHIQSMIAEFGTFMVDAYLNNMRRLRNSKVSPFRWVVATVDSIENNGIAIVIRGKAVPFGR